MSRGSQAASGEVLSDLVLSTLLASSRDGDRRAADTIATAMANMIGHLARRVRSRCDRDELISAGLYGMVQSLATFSESGGASLRSWVSTHALGAMRRTRCPEIAESVDIHDVEEPVQASSRELNSALRNLPANQRKILRLIYRDGLSARAVAARLHMDARTIARLERQGIASMRRELGADP